MAYTTINKPTEHFNTKLYTGTGATQSITEVGFQSDMTWTKSRTTTQSHVLTDAVRGVTKTLFTNATQAEATLSGITAFGTDGYTLGASDLWNENSASFASWNFKGGGTGVANTDGTISSTVSANTTSGFSIVKLDTGTSGNISFGHGLGVAPKVVIIKTTSGGGNWIVGHDSIGWGKYLNLNNTNAEASDSTVWQNTAPTNSVVTTNSTFIYNTGSTIVAYCFAEKQGYSKFGSYTGNGNADGTFVYLGFKPAFLLWKDTSNTMNWGIFDNKRDTFNEVENFVKPNLNDAEAAGDYQIDFLSNGFKIYNANGFSNNSGDTYIYMAFAEAPLVGTNNVPCTAR